MDNKFLVLGSRISLIITDLSEACCISPIQEPGEKLPLFGWVTVASLHGRRFACSDQNNEKQTAQSQGWCVIYHWTLS